MRHKVKRVHFVGIGGAGMSGIAEVLINLGYDVSGSDLVESATTRRLSELGAQVARGHPRRVQPLDDLERLLDLLPRIGAEVRDLVHRGAQQAVLVHVLDDGVADLEGELVRDRHVELPEEVVVEVGLDGEVVLGPEVVVAVLAHRRVAGRLPVLAEVGVEVDVVDRLAVVELAVGRGLGRLLGRLLRRGRRLLLLLGLVPGLGPLLEHRVLGQLLGDQGLELGAGHLQQLDRLLQRRRHHQPLRQLERQFLLEGHRSSGPAGCLRVAAGYSRKSSPR